MAFIMTVTLASGIVVSQAASKAKLLTVDELMEKFPNGKYWIFTVPGADNSQRLDG